MVTQQDFVNRLKSNFDSGGTKGVINGLIQPMEHKKREKYLK